MDIRYMAVVAMLAAAFSVQAKSTSWTGSGDGVSWSLGTNWSAGSPETGDAVVIQPSSGLELTVPAEGVSLASLQVGGTLTLSGGQVTITGAANTSFMSSAATDVITLNCKLSFSSAQNAQLTMPGVWYIRGGLSYPNRFQPKNGTLYIQETPVEVSRLIMANPSTMFLQVSGNALGRVELAANCTLHVQADDPWLEAGFDYLFMNSGNSHIYLHGHGCYVPWLILSGSATSSIDTDAPATLSFDQKSTDVRVNNNIDLTGPLSLRMGTASRADAPYVMNTTLSSTGGLVVESGVFAFGESGNWPNIAYMRLNGGKVQIPSGKTVTVPALYLGDSAESLEDGPYTASTHPDYIAGDGTVLVKAPEVETVALTWNPGQASAEMSIPGNWTENPASVPLTTGGLLATFSTSGSEATHSGHVAMKGAVFDAPNDFTISVGGLSLGSEGLSASGAHAYSVDAPITLAERQTWNVASGASLSIAQAVGSMSEDCAVAKTGAGDVSLAAANSFSSDLTISNGHVVVSDCAALGSGTVGMRKTVTVVQSGGAGLVLPGGTLAKNLRFEGNGTESYKNNTTGLRFEGSNTVCGAFSVTGTARASLAKGSSVDFEGGVSDGWDFRPFNYGGSGVNPLIRFKSAVGDLTISPTTVDLSYETTGNRVKRIEAYSRATIHARVPYAWTRTDAYVYPATSSLINLHGNDQIVGTLLLDGNSTGAGVTSGDEGPATLYITQNHATFSTRTNTVGDIMGRLSIVKGGPLTCYHNCALSTSGDLTVTNGTFAFLENGSWLNGTNFTVTGVSDACKGRIYIASSSALPRHAEVRIGGSGSMELADGVCQRVLSLKFQDGQGEWISKSPGTWGATGSGADNVDDVHFAGSGVLKVSGAGLVIMFK